MATITTAPEHSTVYEPSTFGLPPLRPYVRSVWERRAFIWEMARTKLKAEHYNTVFGQVWILLDPLLMAAVYLLLRTVIRPMGSAEERWALIAHLIVAIFFFSFVRKAVNFGSKAVTSNKALVLNTTFPRGVLPVEAIIRAFFGFLPMLVIYVPLHALLGQSFGLNALLFLPLLLALLTVFNFGLVCLLAPLTVFFRDTESFTGYVVRIWFFTTPILWTVAEMSESVPESVQTWLRWNPLFPFFAMLEQIWNAQVPSIGYIFQATGWALAAVLVGVPMFLVRERDFAVHL